MTVKGPKFMHYLGFGILFCFFITLSTIFGSLAFAHDGVTDKDVLARMVLMSKMATNMKVIGRMTRNTAEFVIKRAEEAFLENARLSDRTPDTFLKRS